MAPLPPSALFALVIGVNKYQSKEIPDLEGSIEDSENFVRFLTDTLHANPLHIKHLRDAEATREGILSAIQTHLIGNDDITPGKNAIVFYFAGHGSYEFADEKLSIMNKMETICPHDDREGTRGIPDRTFVCLMRRLAFAKGNNITAIFDSCHSGGMPRLPDPDLGTPRMIPPHLTQFPEEIDKHIWEGDVQLLAAADVEPHYTPMKSHITLAACQHDEIAHEGYYSEGSLRCGAFTTLLLDLLRQTGRDLDETTYISLFHTLQQAENKARLPKCQTPFVDGYYKSRVLFHTRDPSRQFPVLLGENGAFSVTAGSVHGVDSDTEFRITSGDIGFPSLKPSKVSPLHCSFEATPGLTLSDDSKAEVTKWNQPHVKVFFPDPSDRPPPTDQHYDVVVSRLPNGELELERRDELLPQYVQSVVSYAPLGIHEEDCARIMAGISRFNFFLLHQTWSGPKLVSDLNFKLERLRHDNDNGGYCPVEPRQDLFISGERLAPRSQPRGTAPKVTRSSSLRESELNDLFGFTISVPNISPSTPLFPYVFAFDPLTYEIDCFYHPQPSKLGPLSERQELGVGYGREGGDPVKFPANEVTFFKVFVTSEYVDLTSLKQEPVFKGSTHTARIPGRVPHAPSWESWLYVIGTP